MNNDSTLKAVDLSRAYYEQCVRPLIETHCPELLRETAIGRFGLGSECLGLDDAISRDHHWGPTVNILVPKHLEEKTPAILKDLSQFLPESFQDFPLEAGVSGAPGLTVETLESLLMRTIGRTSAPKTTADWLEIPEEDITHVINGEVWEDAPGTFSAIREVFQEYYPDIVWKRRIAHWCRYASGMGLYPIRRALLRDNLLYATTAFGRALKLNLELVFLLNRTYFPYDKWLYTMFKTLPKLAPEMLPLIDESLEPTCSFENRISLLEEMHTLLDQEMVAMGLIREHPEFVPSETSGYRLLEHAYHDLVAHLPEDVRGIVPLWDQKFLESHHAAAIAHLESKTWDNMLDLKEKK